MTTSRSVIGLCLWIAVCFGAAAIGGLTTPGEWYRALDKPVWTPPDWVFGPVWAVLYLLMGVAAWMVWDRGDGIAGARAPLTLFIVQLALNAAWPWIFFGLHLPGWAFAEAVLLWMAILATLIGFWRVQRAAGALLLPYIAWISIAAALNFEVWRRNAGAG